MKRIYITFFLLFSAYVVSAQTPNQSIYGYVLDSATQRPLEGATVLYYTKGTSTDAQGRFSLTWTPNSNVLQISFQGYQSQTITVDDPTQNIIVRLAPGTQMLNEVVVLESSDRQQVASVQMGIAKVNQQTAKLLPALFGEVDVIKVFQLKPGVKNAGEGTSGISVRGGGTDQNLFLLDGAPVYNPSHLFGFFSTFNIDAVKDVTLYKAGFPAEYSGRLSSVVDVSTRSASDTMFHVGGGIGLLASRLNVSGPIVKNKLAYRVTARRTYADVFTNLINNANAGDTSRNPIPSYFFYDLNGRLDYLISDRTDLSASVYTGRDRFQIDPGAFNTDFSWGNSAASLRLNHRFSDRLATRMNLIFADYNYAITSEFDRFAFNVASGIRDYGLQNQYRWTFPRHTLKVGWDVMQSQFSISRFNIASSQADENLNRGENLNAYEGGVYADDEFDLGPLKVNAGLRLSGFASDQARYVGLEPRLGTRLLVNDDLSFKANYSRMIQYRHLVVSSGASLPTDIWYPSTERIRPEYSDQISTGLSWKLNDQFLLTNEVYYKWLNRVVDYKPGAQLFVNANLEEEFVFGNGQAYGNEFYLEKTSGRLRGWIGYTLAYTWRQFDEINQGERFYPRYDRRHDISVVASYDLNQRVQLALTWVYNTGNAVSVPGGRFAQVGIPGATDEEERPFVIVSDYPARNNYRMPAYHRLDLSLVYQLRPRRGEADLTFGIYNAYNRLNPYLLSFQAERNAENVPTGFTAQSTTLFPILPSITYNFRF
ncbi:TonB-dependent receptor [Tunicatimonas pelagia]|uniref:TonB-dependent receptor n=1 Tax=Tunicatimonas pelagia TaxID=931531 RepID=UPI002666A5E0|nr:TonB-dependent receptor [Tunicatimonas pelagia]WKN44973.1 TonB-dependent receptor [Tunicatimonas pelagia]